MRPRYSGRQLVLAKAAVVALIACLAGPGVANTPAEIPITIVVVVILLGAAVGVYEALSRGLAIVVGRFWNDTTDNNSLAVESSRPAYEGALRQRDVITALLIFLGAEAAVWVSVGVVAASRVGKGAERADLLEALTGLVPIALPASLIAGGVTLVLVLRRWRQRLGPVALASLVGLSQLRPREIRDGTLAGAALAVFILPLMGLVADRAEPPDVMTQLAGSSNAALRAWMLSAVLLAPLIEELMFRGVLLGGLAETWNLRAAVVLSGLTFWLMHGPEFVHWPAALAIALLTVLATWLRVRTRSVGPSIGAHLGYNLVLAAVVWLGMTYGPVKSKWARDHQPAPLQGSALPPLEAWTPKAPA